MPTTSFPEYAKAITLLIDTLLASGQASVVNNAAHRPLLPLAEHKHTASAISPTPAPTFMQVIDEIFEKGICGS